jgi:hypothetical protein
MTTLLFANNAQSTLAAPVTTMSTTASLAAGTGSLFPSPQAGQGFYITFNDALTGLLKEIVLVTSIVGDQILVMQRAQQGTAAQNWKTGDYVSQLYTAGDADVFLQTAYSTATTVAALTTQPAGARACVTDSTLPATGNFGSAVIGGSNNIVPVWSNGANWYIG